MSWGDSSAVSVGEPVAAIGSPFGEDRSLSVGVVSATDRSIQSLTRFQIEGAIQTDASINPGNSGGPLLDADANVIGIDQQINTTSGGNEGVGFALPIDLAARSLDELRREGTVDYAYIGVSTQSLYPQLADRLGIPQEAGALVAKVLDVYGYVRGAAEQTPEVVHGIKLAISLYASIPFLLCCVLLFFYAINKSTESQIEGDLAQRRAAAT